MDNVRSQDLTDDVERSSAVILTWMFYELGNCTHMVQIVDCKFWTAFKDIVKGDLNNSLLLRK